MEFVIVLVSLIIGVFVYKKLQKINRQYKNELLEKLVKIESEITERPSDCNDAKYLCLAKYNGGYSKYPVAFKTYIFSVGAGLYFQHFLNPNLWFRVDVNKIIDFGAFAPSIPYVMNLDVAGVLANEMTRREIGNSVFIEFLDELEMVQSISLGEFKESTAEDFVRHVHSDFEKRLIA